MGTIKSVLAATDFSVDGRNAAERAALLAAEQQAELSLLHVMSGPSLESLRAFFHIAQEAEAKLVGDAQRVLNELAAKLVEKTGRQPLTQVRVGRVRDEILTASEGADLLVLGARGWNPVRDAILGTTAERLLNKRQRPVLVTKRAPHGPYRRVLVPVDFSPSSTAALALAARVAPKADIIVVHAFEVPFEGSLALAGVSEREMQEYRISARQQALDDIARLEKETAAEAQHYMRVVEHGGAAPLILAQATERDVDLIVMGKHGRSLVEETLLGSVTRHVLSDATCDVLVVQ